MAIRNDTRKAPAGAGNARERLVRTAYALFQRNSLNTVGVDRIVADADVAKTTLYRHFPSKDDLAVSVLGHHEDVWTRGWLEQAIERHETVGARLLGLFDAFDDWFRRDDYEGCLFARTLLETRDPASRVRAAAAAGLANVRALIRGLAEEAGVHDPDVFALQIQMLLLGATVAAVYGDLDAAHQAREVARLLLERKGIPTES
ncbi:MAG: TetR/AcrR family transcriptional regulator [Actinobacteria bacterium]|nr:MAG: TetR/AcrR family transcriptional regulator [Actinomycetota bacterium]